MTPLMAKVIGSLLKLWSKTVFVSQLGALVVERDGVAASDDVAVALLEHRELQLGRDRRRPGWSPSGGRRRHT